ncbi:hypothetical protein BTO16_02790 [Polaribacter glomeratus]|uniref:Uncharacterized protein n=2 Tax=Polaribacter glomeratus TaxID=102 RepID=A0A2S7WVD5_9FLAO|nr:hypothetical protein BTO16_02790 [Polaribacter glomeratus]
MFYAFCIQISYAQEIRVIDNKGTLKTAINNRVTSSSTSPILPLEGDVWFDNADASNIITKIYDGTSWILVNTKVNKLQDADGDTKVEVEKNTDEDIIRFQTLGTERMLINSTGNVAIGNPNPNAKAILDLTNTQKFALLLPSELIPVDIITPTDGMLMYSSQNENAYLRAGSAWKPITFNNVTNELIFEGTAANSNFYYVSMLINNDWKVIKYDKTDVNVEVEATVLNNPGQTAQPTTLAQCESLTYN